MPMRWALCRNYFGQSPLPKREDNTEENFLYYLYLQMLYKCTYLYIYSYLDSVALKSKFLIYK